MGLYIEQICLAGLFFLATDSQGRRSSIAQGALMVVLFAITLASHVLFVHSYGREYCWNSHLEDDLIVFLQSSYQESTDCPLYQEDPRPLGAKTAGRSSNPS